MQLFLFQYKFDVNLIVVLYKGLYFLHHELFFISEYLFSVLQLAFDFIFKVKLCILLVPFYTLVVKLSNFGLGLHILV